MSATLVTPRQFFLVLKKADWSSFLDWQLVIEDMTAKTTLYGEIEGQVSLSDDCVFCAALKWGTQHHPKRGWSKFHWELVAIPLEDKPGASFNEGGCHFDSDMERKTKFYLFPPGTVEKGQDAERWEKAKQIALQE